MHLSAGDLLRAERKKPDSKVGAMIDKHIREGTIVPVEITCGLLAQVCLSYLFLVLFIDIFLVLPKR